MSREGRIDVSTIRVNFTGNRDEILLGQYASNIYKQSKYLNRSQNDSQITIVRSTIVNERCDAELRQKTVKMSVLSSSELDSFLVFAVSSWYQSSSKSRHRDYLPGRYCLSGMHNPRTIEILLSLSITCVLDHARRRSHDVFLCTRSALWPRMSLFGLATAHVTSWRGDSICQRHLYDSSLHRFCEYEFFSIYRIRYLLNIPPALV